MWKVAPENKNLFFGLIIPPPPIPVIDQQASACDTLSVTQFTHKQCACICIVHCILQNIQYNAMQ